MIQQDRCVHKATLLPSLDWIILAEYLSKTNGGERDVSYFGFSIDSNYNIHSVDDSYSNSGDGTTVNIYMCAVAMHSKTHVSTLARACNLQARTSSSGWLSTQLQWLRATWLGPRCRRLGLYAPPAGTLQLDL